MKREELSIHPYLPFIPTNAKKLLIGSIPPPRFCTKSGILKTDDVNFYYGSCDNLFWKLVSKIINNQLRYENSESAVEERKKILENLKIGITDIVLRSVYIKTILLLIKK